MFVQFAFAVGTSFKRLSFIKKSLFCLPARIRRGGATGRSTDRTPLSAYSPGRTRATGTTVVVQRSTDGAYRSTAATKRLSTRAHNGSVGRRSLTTQRSSRHTVSRRWRGDRVLQVPVRIVCRRIAGVYLRCSARRQPTWRSVSRIFGFRHSSSGVLFLTSILLSLGLATPNLPRRASDPECVAAI